MKKAEVYSRVLKGTKFEDRDVAKHFHLMVWSKFRIAEDQEDNKMIEKFEHRFQSILPIQKIDLILYVTTGPPQDRSSNASLASQKQKPKKTKPKGKNKNKNKSKVKKSKPKSEEK